MKHQPPPLDGVSIANGCYFGLTESLSLAKIALLSVPWDATVSYRAGAANGPQAIITASTQVDWYDFDFPNAWQIGWATIPIDASIYTKSQTTRAIAQTVIAHLSAGGALDEPSIQPLLKQVNQACEELNQWVYEQTKGLLQQDKFVGLVGGDHSVPLGYLRALAEQQDTFGILQIDAHADLRQAYEGFTYSHASIMDQALKLPEISQLVQVGVRDLCPEEMARIQGDRRIILFDDWQLKANAYEGLSWQQQCAMIIETLPHRVYVSFDIDGLEPSYCPHTGTPVPGGLTFNQGIYLLQMLVKAGNMIIGFDLCEVAPGPSDEWDGNVGARLLYKLANLMYLSQSQGIPH